MSFAIPSEKQGDAGSLLSPHAQGKGDVLSRWCNRVCLSAWTFFIGFQIFIGCDRFYSSKPLCPYSEKEFDPPAWYTAILYTCLGGFFMIWMAMALKVYLTESSKARVLLFVGLQIVSMGTIATILAVFWEWGGFCIDILDVASPAAIWAEWMACGPLLIFITVTIVDKPAISTMDLFMMGSFWVCLATGFFIIIPSDIALGQFWLAVSCITYIPVLYLPFYEAGHTYFQTLKDGNMSGLREFKMFTERYAMQRNLAMVLTIVLPLYTVNYLLGLYHVIDYLQTNVIYQILSVLTKGLFAATTMDIHADMLIKTELREEQRANEARRAFMKYLFHEVRTPLNSLTMGIDMLKMSDSLHTEEKEYLVMMTGATEFMSDTLNNVLNMHKIEEGKLELDQAPFSIVDSVNKVVSALHGMTAGKAIVMLKDYAANVPALISGDRYRVEHIISNLISNAVKFSPDGGQVTVTVTSKVVTADDAGVTGKALNTSGKSISSMKVAEVSVPLVDITLVVKDLGPGISAANQTKLFSNFMQIRPSMLQKGQGSGLGLALCKAIVELHGGKIGVESEEGFGSSFFFTIRFPVVEQGEAPQCNDIESQMVSQNALLKPQHQSFATTPMNLSNKSSTPLLGISNKSNRIVLSPISTPPELTPKQTTPVAQEAPSLTNAAALVSVESADGRLRALVVDDVESNRKMLKALVKRLKIDAVCEENGQLAVQKVVADMHLHQLVLMDNLMPVMNGMQAAKAMRLAGYPYIIAGVTGNVMEDDVAEYLDAGADTVFAKPMRVDSLKKLLQLIETQGPLSQGVGMTLIERTEGMEWVPRSTKK